MASIEGWIWTEYASAILIQVENLATQLKAEQVWLQQLICGQQNQQRSLADFAKVIESKKIFFRQNLSEDNRGTIDQLFLQVNDRLENACITTQSFQDNHRMNVKELKIYQLHLHGPVDLQKQLEMTKNCKKMKSDMEEQNSAQGRLGEMENRRQNDIDRKSVV